MNKRSSAANTLLLFVTMGVLCACPAGSQTSAASGGAVASADASPTDQEYQAFARQLTEAVRSQKFGAISAMLDEKALTDRCTAGLGLTEAQRADFDRGFHDSSQNSGGALGQIAKGASGDGSIRLLRIVSAEPPKRARFRLVMANSGGVNYLDLILARSGDGKIRAVDFYSFASGEYVSQTLRRSLLAMSGSQNPEVLAHLTGNERQFIENADQFEKLAMAVREGHGKEALAAYEALPESLQKDKLAMLMRVRAAMNLDATRYSQAMEAYQKQFPNDASTALILIDHMILSKQYEKALEMIDQMDRAVGGDPYLNVMRSGVLITARRYPDAIRAAEKAVHDCPDMADSHFALIGACIVSKRYGPIPAELDVLQRDLHIPLQDLRKVPEYAGFVKSPEYRVWKRARARHH